MFSSGASPGCAASGTNRPLQQQHIQGWQHPHCCKRVGALSPGCAHTSTISMTSAARMHCTQQKELFEKSTWTHHSNLPFSPSCCQLRCLVCLLLLCLVRCALLLRPLCAAAAESGDAHQRRSHVHGAHAGRSRAAPRGLGQGARWVLVQ